MPAVATDVYNYHCASSQVKIKSLPDSMIELGRSSTKQVEGRGAGRLALWIATAVSSLGGFLFGYDNM